MQKLFLGVSAFYVSILCSFAQTAAPDSAVFKSRKLAFDEANLVSSYYQQDGSHSAVTGGIGSEKLTDVANTISLTMLRTDLKNRLHTFGMEFGIDHYTSASSDKIDPSTISSASYGDNRIYPSLSWQMHDEAKHYSVGAGLAFSSEYDYFSKGINLNISKFSADNNREIGLKINAFLDTWKIIYPIELRTLESSGGLISNPAASGSKPRNSFNGALTLAQVVNKRLQIALLAEAAYQTGQLGTLCQRIYFKDGSETVENLPKNRFKLPLGFRANFFPGDKFIIRTFYRYYTDDWGISAHTAEFEVPYKFSPFVSVSPFYRYYSQTASDYFAPYQQHDITDEFYTSDYDLSKFSSNMFGVNLRINSPDGLLSLKHLNTLELRYGHYQRSNNLQANIITLAATVK